LLEVAREEVYRSVINSIVVDCPIIVQEEAEGDCGIVLQDIGAPLQDQ
jgi:hypothetical protein